ncbi:Phosphomethylpyrimidine kinase-domain-containing protein [Pelagophyceae sp. CCMP2097]|nr:Phosphomethylpyrimidine kinase-domain-containing protein [Pelagophyceae sp. CCMP2097]
MARPAARAFARRCLLLCAVGGRSGARALSAVSKRPIAWTIAGSDSGGGAGVEADLRAFHALGVHGCSVVTGLTAQNTLGVFGVAVTPAAHVRATLAALEVDLAPDAVKVGMLCTAATAIEVADYFEARKPKHCRVVVDPLLASSSGTKLIDDEGRAVVLSRVLPRCDVLTPNAREAEQLLGWAAGAISAPADVRRAAAALVEQTKAKSILLKGGHWDADTAWCRDYFYDGNAAWWLASPRLEDAVAGGAHGTGCVLSSALAAALASGAPMLDALVVAKGVCHAAIANAPKLGAGAPAALASQTWPVQGDACPTLRRDVPAFDSFFADNAAFPPPTLDGCAAMGLYAIGDSASRCEELFDLGVSDVQLRVKDQSLDDVDAAVVSCVSAARRCNKRLWVNDHWRLAAKHGAYGVHLGQEDLEAATPADLNELLESGLRLGLSTHCESELALALQLRPSYVALGPIFGTTSKSVPFSPRGVDMVSRWRALLPPTTPLVCIGGITLDTAASVVRAGADSIAVISALPRTPYDAAAAVEDWLRLF